MKETLQWVPLFSGTGSTDSWRAQNPQLFHSDESLRHYFRQHRRELIERGAIVRHRGQWQATPRMPEIVAEIARGAARRSVEVA